MKWSARVYLPLLFVLSMAGAYLVFGQHTRNVTRPEEIRSKRVVIFDDQTYQKLDSLWQNYYHAFPSEYAYANWMYAARYAGNPHYTKWLARGLKKYPSNPVLLYLSALQKNNESDNRQGREYLEKAIAIDPGFIDPWFALVTIYMERGEDDRLNDALRRILESGYITDDILDYNYNVLIGLDSNAVLVTNGDNDTYPAWILIRVLKIRPDVTIVNRSLLNAPWYSTYLLSHGAPRFIAKDEIEPLQKAVLAELQTRKLPMPAAGLLSDTLTVRIMNRAQAEGRPVYFCQTLYENDLVKRCREQGRLLGLAVLVTPSTQPYADQLHRLYATWLKDYRTGGLDGWRLRSAKPTDAGLMIACNYAMTLLLSTDSMQTMDTAIVAALREWSRRHLESLLPDELRQQLNSGWDECLSRRIPGK